MEATHPWLCPLDARLIAKTDDFIKFLSFRMSNLNPNEEFEVKIKLNDLIRWNNISKQILSIGHLPNFVDLFSMPVENVSFMDKCLSSDGKIFHVLSFDEGLNNNSSNDESKFNNNICSGFMFDLKADCLRDVRTDHESRQIYRAYRCEFDPESKRILKVYSSEKVIVKKVAKHPTNNLFNTRLMREFKVQSLLSDLGHKSFNKLFHFTENRSCLISVSRSAGDFDLLESLQKQVEMFKSGFSEDSVRTLFKPAVEGLVTAHNLNICHRDISLENFVISDMVLKNPHLEIIDWGHSASASIGSKTLKYEGKIGKSRYFSPELVFNESEIYDPFKADVFALGVCLYSCLVGSMPFKEMEISDFRVEVLRDKGISGLLNLNKMNELLTVEAVDLLNGCLRWGSEERFTMAEVLSHPFFNK